MIEISIIVVTFNSEAVLGGLLDSLERHAPKRSWELIVTDNASDDASVNLVRKRFPSAKIIQNASNRGFSAGVNAAAGCASGNYLLLANPDVTWIGSELDCLALFLDQHPKAGVVTPRLVFPDGRPQPSTRRLPTHSNIWFSHGTPWGRRWDGPGGRWTYTLPDPPHACTVEAVSGAFLMLRRDAFEAIGMLDEEYFLYVEDTDLSRRLWDDGWEVWIEPAIAVSHRWGGYRKRSPILWGYHRDGIRRYFLKHHPEKRLRNEILLLALKLSGWLGHAQAGERSG